MQNSPVRNTIVIVDDTHLYQEILKENIEKAGFSALLCGDGVQAIECLEKNHPVVKAVFLDIHMPQIDGISVLGHFRSNYPELPVYMITGSEEEADKRVAGGLGAAGFIKKPFSAENINDIIKSLLSGNS